MKWGDSIDSAFPKKDADLVKRILNIKPQKADVIVVFAGLPKLVDKVVELYNKGYAKKVAALGGNSYPFKANPKQTADDYKELLVEKGVRKGSVSADSSERAGNTRIACETVTESMGAGTLLFVVQGYHMPRAFATWVKTLMDKKLDKKIKVIPAPLMRKDWSTKDKDLQNSWINELKAQELPRIEKYQEKGDVASWAQVEKYLKFHGLY